VEHTPYVEEVLRAVESIPAGYVMTYGEVAELVGAGGPRQVGRVMAEYGGGVPWWRVVRADGSPAPGHEHRALALLAGDGTPMRPDGRRIDMRAAHWAGPA
jgi:alkylated DNA nucleotide flippase Atl1